MTSNKHVNLGKTKHFVRGKCNSEVISKYKGKKAYFRESWKKLKIIDEYLTYKVKRIVTMIMIEGNHNT